MKIEMLKAETRASQGSSAARKLREYVIINFD